jgi:hypothetical protein
MTSFGPLIAMTCSSFLCRPGTSGYCASLAQPARCHSRKPQQAATGFSDATITKVCLVAAQRGESPHRLESEGHGNSDAYAH